MPRTLSTVEILTTLSSPELRVEFLNSWPTLRCALCDNHAATGVWACQFSKQTPPYVRLEMKLLCPACGLTDCYRKWNGFMSPRLVRCDLFVTITCPEGDRRTPADHLLEKIASHPTGEGYIRAWRLMFKPANIHHPLKPAFEMLVALRDKLFPPNDNKVD